MTVFDRMARPTWTVALLVVVLGPTAARAAERNWTLTFGVGFVAAGELFTARSQTSQPWTTPDGRPLDGKTLTTELSEAIGGWFRVRRALTPNASVALGIGLTDMDIKASIKRETNTVDTDVLYDQMFAVMTDLVAIYDLQPTGNTVYVLGGAGLNSLGFETRVAGGSIDQSVFGFVVGAGYRVRAMEGMEFELEVRDSISWPDLSAEEARLAADSFDANTLHLFQFTLGWAFSF